MKNAILKYGVSTLIITAISLIVVHLGSAALWGSASGLERDYNRKLAALEAVQFQVTVAEYEFCQADSTYAKDGLSKYYGGKLELTTEEVDSFTERAEKNCGDVPQFSPEPQGDRSVAFAGALEGIVSYYEGDKLIIESDTPMQCGEFVNRLWGLPRGGQNGFGDSFESKRRLIDQRGVYAKSLNLESFQQYIKPGMAFVMDGGSVGHVGIVTKTYSDLSFDTFEANIVDGILSTPDAPIAHKRFLHEDGLIGFVPPPGEKIEAPKEEYDISKLAYSIAMAETNDCTKGMGLSKNNCFGIMHWPNGIRTGKTYGSKDESYADFARIWKENYDTPLTYDSVFKWVYGPNANWDDPILQQGAQQYLSNALFHYNKS